LLHSETALEAGDRAPGDGTAPCVFEYRIFLAGLIVILVAAAFLRFSALDSQGRHMDEYGQTKVYNLPLRYVVLAAQQQVCQPQLDYLLGWALAKVEDSDWMRRFPAALFGVIGVAGCAILARRLFSWQVGLLAAAMLAVSPMHWSLSRIARPYNICVAATLFMLWTLARALDRPARTRLIAYAAAAYFMTLTRSLLPLLILFTTGAVIAASLAIAHIRSTPPSSDNLHVLKRVGLVTLFVALAAVPMPTALLPNHDVPLTVFGTLAQVCAADFGVFPPPVVPFVPTLMANVAEWLKAAVIMFGPLFPLVLGLACAGVIICARRHSGMSLGANCTLAVVALVGPLYQVIFSAAAPRAKMMAAYAIFMVPIVGLFAAVSLVSLARAFRRLVRGGPILEAAAVTVLLLVVASPALYAILAGYDPLYRRPDWRGCADYLVDKTTSDDVIITFEDRKLGPGWTQPNFWGKYDWPAEKQRPLAESAWTLVASQAHWQRLIAKTGRCLIVVKNFGDTDESASIQPSAGMTARTFRGLTLLSRPSPEGDPTARMIRACDDLITLPKRYADANAFLYVLRSRLQLHSGDAAAATESFQLAQRIVQSNPLLKDWFALAAEHHRTVLASAVNERRSARSVTRAAPATTKHNLP